MFLPSIKLKSYPAKETMLFIPKKSSSACLYVAFANNHAMERKNVHMTHHPKKHHAFKRDICCEGRE
jgi:hypothetical protein